MVDQKFIFYISKILFSICKKQHNNFNYSTTLYFVVRIVVEGDNLQIIRNTSAVNLS